MVIISKQKNKESILRNPHKRGDKKKDYIIEYNYPRWIRGHLARGNNWTLYKRYESNKQAEQALNQLRKNTNSKLEWLDKVKTEYRIKE